MFPQARQRQTGFTLIEIMIALVIVSVAVLAVATALTEHTKMATSLEKRLLAGWVASNQLALIRHQAKKDKVKAGNRSDTIDMGGHRWRTRARVEETDVERVFLVTVTVLDDSRPRDQPYASLTSAVSDSFLMKRHLENRQINKHHGFTLIEVVVAVSIFAVIAAIIFPALIQFLDTRERLDEKHKQVVGLQKAFLFLSNDLRFATNRLPKDEFGDLSKTTIKLNDDSLLDFTANYPDLNIAGLSVPRRVIWRVIDGELQRVQYPVMDPDSETRTIVQRLLNKVREVEVEISYIKDGRDNKDDQWEEQTRLPDLIEIVIELDNDLIFNRILTMQGGDSALALLAATNDQASSNLDTSGFGEDVNGTSPTSRNPGERNR